MTSLMVTSFPNHDLLPSCRTYMNIIYMWSLPSTAFLTILTGLSALLVKSHINIDLFESQSLLRLDYSLSVCCGLQLLMNNVYLYVASVTDKYGLNVKSWTSLWFGEIFLYCENCLSAAGSFILWVCVRDKWVRNRHKWPYFVLNFNSCLQLWTEKAWWRELEDMCNPESKRVVS